MISKELLDKLFTKGAAYLDIETLGTAAGSSPIHQIGLLLGSDKGWTGHEYYPNPSISRAQRQVVDIVGNISHIPFDPFRAKPGERTLHAYKDWNEALSVHGDDFSRRQLAEGNWVHLRGVKQVSGSVSYGNDNGFLTANTVVHSSGGVRLSDEEVKQNLLNELENKYLDLKLKKRKVIRDHKLDELKTPDDFIGISPERLAGHKENTRLFHEMNSVKEEIDIIRDRASYIGRYSPARGSYNPGPADSELLNAALEANRAINPVSSSSVGKVTRDMFSELSRHNPNAILWIANSKFEGSHLGTALENSGHLHEVNRLFTYQSVHPTNRNFLQTSDPGVLNARSHARVTGDWRGVGRAILAVDTTQPGLKPFDVQDIIRAGQSYAQTVNAKYNLGMDFSNLYSGTSLSTQARIMGLPSEIHMAMQDNQLSQIVGNRVATHMGALDDIASMSRRGSPMLQQSHRDALNWAWKMSRVKEVSSPLYARNAVAQAMLDRVKSEMNKTEYAHSVSNGYKQISSEKLFQGNRISIPVTVADYKVHTSYPEALEALEKSRKESLVPHSIRLEEEIKGMSHQRAISYLESIISNTPHEINSVLDNALSDIPEHILAKIGNQGVKKTSNTLMHMGLVGAGLAAIVTGIGVWKGLTKTFNTQESKNYNPVNGLNEDGYAAYLRKSNTDFGSPYRGLIDSISLKMASILTSTGTPVYVSNSIPVDQKIVDFHDQMMQTPLQKKIIQAQLTKSSLESMSSTYFLDPSLTTPVASEDYSRLGLNSRKQLQEVNLKDMSYSVEDADTLVLKHGLKGVMGQSMSIRLAGIDAPEVEHSDEGAMSYLRYRQAQPYGEEATNKLREIMKNAKEIKVIVDPQQDTYGRSLGVIVADGRNINAELVKTGSALSLPFGDPSQDIISRSMITNYENQAYQSKKGLWGSDYWRTYKQTMTDKVRTTNNTFTRLDRLASNMNLASLSTTMQYAENNNIDDYVRQAQNTLRPRLADLNKPKKFEPPTVIPLNYRSDHQNLNLDQLKFEVKSNMKNYGNLNTELLKSKSNMDISQGLVVDSLYQSTSVYRADAGSIVKEYRSRAQKSYRGKMQRQGNKNMNQPTQNAGKW